ncbi:hypothetical protein [Lyngbya sp. PCC 8106]|uniref:hypothetical protein n=1 Tax=Lyngbya sp. (strain PCC 8106) TaxID=313612 RepID=UPI0000EA9E7D|nr:hypothetical protein [Lyngbya sp. PCC 8106]EAW38874.1 hypothetical protein L8106_01127 [Lyngbya sp. PCC 8106]
MCPQEFDLIQRIRIEDGVPRVISTRIQVIEGGEDLMSLAINLLKELGFYDKFEEKRTSQYIGYKLKNPRKGAKRYQLILQERKGELCISIPENLLEKNTLKIFNCEQTGEEFPDTVDVLIEQIWVVPSKEDIFLKTIQSKYGKLGLEQLNSEVVGSFYPFCREYEFSGFCGEYEGYVAGMEVEYLAGDFDMASLGDPDTYLTFQEDKLFPYTKQFCIKSPEVVQEFLNTFGKIIMEQN